MTSVGPLRNQKNCSQNLRTELQEYQTCLPARAIGARTASQAIRLVRLPTGPLREWHRQPVGKRTQRMLKFLEILGTGSTYSLKNQIGAAPPSQEAVDNNAAYF